MSASPAPSSAPPLLDGANVGMRDVARTNAGELVQVMAGRTMDSLPNGPIMRKGWAHMQGLMQTNPDHSPLVTPLVEMFHLP
jgi:hypothetical protein